MDFLGTSVKRFITNDRMGSLKDYKILLIHHGDLDGIMPVIISELISRYIDNITFQYVLAPVSADSVIGEVEDDELESYDAIFIVDVSLKNKNNIDKLQKLYENGMFIQLLDHHSSVVDLNEYDWAYVLDYNLLPQYSNKSATNMYHEYVKNVMDYLPKPVQNLLEIYVDLTGEYDTYHFKETGDVLPYKLNQLFKSYSREVFIEEIICNLTDRLCIFSNKQQIIINTMYNVIGKAIGTVKYNMYTFVVYGYKVAIAFNTTPYASEISDSILTEFPCIDFIALVNPSIEAVRLTTKKDDVDILTMAVRHGGGGHKYACGCPLSSFVLVGDCLNVETLLNDMARELVRECKFDRRLEAKESYVYNEDSEFDEDWIQFNLLGKNAQLAINSSGGLGIRESNKIKYIKNNSKLVYSYYDGTIIVLDNDGSDN